MGSGWTFEDRQAIGWWDIFHAVLLTAMVVWPPFFGASEFALAARSLPQPFSAPFFSAVIRSFIVTGAGIGILSSAAAVAGAACRVRWLARMGPYLTSCVWVALRAWSWPRELAGYPMLWTSALSRTLFGIALAVPATWIAVQIATKSAGAHPYRDLFRSPLR